jgi:hypothetical protein
MSSSDPVIQSTDREAELLALVKDNIAALSEGATAMESLMAERVRLRAALREAIDDIQAWGVGSALLNNSKDILAADIAKYRRVLGEDA